MKGAAVSIKRHRWWAGCVAAGLVAAGLVIPAPVAAANLPVITNLPFKVRVPNCGPVDFKAAADLDIVLARRNLPLVTRINEPVNGETGIVRHGIVANAKQAALEANLALPWLGVARANALYWGRLEAIVTEDQRAGQPPPTGLGAKYREGREEYVDSQGNVVQVWCLMEVPGVHGGKDLGVYFKGNGVSGWIGACVFFAGRNSFSFQSGGQTGTFGKVRWINVDPFSDKGWAYTYDLATKKLRMDKLKVSPTKYESLRFETGDPFPAFKDIEFDFEQITLNDAPSGPNRLTEAIALATPGLVHDFALVGLDDTELDDVALIRPGDRLTILRNGIRNARVTDNAAARGWTVAGWTSTSAVFEYAGAEPIRLDPGIGEGGLVIESPAAAEPADSYGPFRTEAELAELAAAMTPLPNPATSATVMYEVPDGLASTDLLVNVFTVGDPLPPPV
jgi:hypothetical protein